MSFFNFSLCLLGLITIFFCLSSKADLPKEKDAAFASLNQAHTSKKKKILIFSSLGGGGHISVSRAIKTYLGDKYNITVVNTIVDPLASVDPMRGLSLKKHNGVEFYNYLISKRLNRSINFVAKFGARMFLIQKKKIVKLLQQRVEQENPDMIVSVFPIFNFAFLDIAKKLDLPFLVVTNDLDTHFYTNGIYKPNYKKFMYTIPYEDRRIRSKFASAKIPEEQIKVSGFPIRADFFEKKDKEKIRKDFNIPNNKKVIMVLMGAAGSSATYKYARRMAKMNLPIHMLLCIGRDEKTRKKLEKLKTNSNVSKSVIGFTSRISDLMAVSDLFISKPGPNSMSEALYMNLPMALDRILKPLRWEKLNLTFVKKNKFGSILRNYRDLKKAILNIAFNQKNNAAIRENMKNFKKELFSKKINSFVEEMIKK
jgi:processive 1,2-diacylglycerol beta-glucosyltransferase